MPSPRKLTELMCPNMSIRRMCDGAAVSLGKLRQGISDACILRRAENTHERDVRNSWAIDGDPGRVRSVDSSRSRSCSPRQGHQSHQGKSPARQSLSVATHGQRRSWADRMSDSEEEQMDYSKVPTFSDSEAEDQPPSKLMEVSEKTRKCLHEKCTQRGRF